MSATGCDRDGWHVLCAASATALAWHLAGRPRRGSLPAAPVPGTCAVCGTGAAETVPAKATIGNATFTDQHLLKASSSGRTCYPCAWAMAGKPPQALRLWTVAAAPGRDLGPSHPKAALVPVRESRPGLLLTARNDMRAVAALLCSPPDGPWAVAVAESGQKHTLPWTAVNHGAGRWRVRMDAVDVTATPAQFAAVLGRCAALRLAGFTAAETEALDPRGKLDARRLPAWREHAQALTPWRSSPVIHLAAFLINKEHADAYRAAYCPA